MDTTIQTASVLYATDMSRLNRTAMAFTKSGMPGADTVTMEVVCYTAQYAEGVELAEAARAALDYRQGELDGIRMRSCILVDSEEGYEDDAYVQQLVFQVKI